jgi:hypothetical protein
MITDIKVLLNVYKPVLIEYYRTQNSIQGVVIAIDANNVGWSLCNKRDKFNKEKGLFIALNRAIKSSYTSEDEVLNLSEKVPRTLRPLYLKMRRRSQLYFK